MQISINFTLLLSRRDYISVKNAAKNNKCRRHDILIFNRVNMYLRICIYHNFIKYFMVLITITFLTELNIFLEHLSTNILFLTEQAIFEIGCPKDENKKSISLPFHAEPWHGGEG